MTVLLSRPSPPPMRSLPTRSLVSGLVEPQIRRVPPYSESVGVEAVEHYESCSEIVPLDWWQREWVVDTLGVRRDGTWAAFEAALAVQRQNGKGQPTDVIELAGLFLFGELLVVHSAHQMKTSREAFRRIAKIVEGTASLSRKVRRVMRSKGEEGLELMDGRRLMFFSRSDGSGRGFSGQRNVADEGQELDGEEMATIVPTLAAQLDAQIIYTFTPPRRSGTHVAALRRRAIAGTDDRTVYWGWHNERPADPRAYALLLDDPEAYARANPAYPHRITAERMADMRRAINDDELFGRECLGFWPEDEADGWLVIPRGPWSDAHDSLSVPREPVAIGVDVLGDRSAAAIGAAGHRVDGRSHIEVTGRDGQWDYRPGVGWVLPRLRQVEENQPCVLVINDWLLAEAAEQAGLTVYRPQVRDVAAWCGAFYDAVAGPHVESRNLRHRGQEVLDDAVRVAAWRPAGGARAWSQNPVLTAVSLALGSLHTPRVHRRSRMPVAAFVDTDPAPSEQETRHPLGLAAPPPANPDPTCQKCRGQHQPGPCP